MRIIKIASFAIVVFGLVACGSLYTKVSKRELVVQTRMSKTVFLEPVAAAKRIVYVEVRNTSDTPEFTFQDDVESALRERGYDITQDPGKANFMLQANVLSVSRYAEDSGGKWESGLTGAALGGASGHILSDGGGNATLGGAALGGVLATAGDAMVKDVTYNVTTDIRISERLKDFQPLPGQGENPEWTRHNVRVLSTANKANLKFEDALPKLQKGLAQSLAGLF